MKLRIPLLLLLSLGSVRAQQPAVVLPAGWSGERIDIREVRIDGVRPLKEIGIRRTQIDTLVLRENIALSMADVLTFSSPLFVKSHGRATLSTVSFRGTSPSHTQVTWNGMRINSPMLGMPDFSLIPAYFIDRATLLHGTSSVTDTGGGLGGAIRLRTATNDRRGFGVQYVQGIGSFRTFDEFARFTYGDERWQVSTRAVLSSSPNDYPYVNRDRKENIYDDEHRIVGQYYPRERNRSGAYRDLHVLQEVGYRTRGGDRLSLSAWWLDSDRELAALTTEYSDPTDFENRQRERTLRGVLAWEHTRERWKVAARAGYVHSRLRYDYSADKGNGTLEPMIRSRSRTETFYGEVEGEYAPSRAWLLTGSVALHQHRVHSADRTILTQSGEAARVEYDERRAELSAALTARWRPTDRLGLSLVLREELFGTERSPLIPAFFADYVLSKRGQLTAKASLSRNYRFPTLNDLYFKPGGNPDLRSESGFSYEGGLSFRCGCDERWTLSGSAAWFDQHIDDWILWLPTTKGFFSPRNVREVHAYGVEVQASFDRRLGRAWRLGLDGCFSWTRSVNEGDPMSPADRSVGRQLPYVPECSATLAGRLSYGSWSLLYKWCHYSHRNTMSNESRSLTGYLPPYYMNNLTLEKGVSLRWADLSLKGSVENLFDEEYLSVLSHPMPGIHFEIFLGIKPKWGKGSKANGE